MDDVLMRPMFRDAYISKQKQQMKKLKTGGLASIKKFNLGGSVSFTPEEKQAYMLAPVIGSLLQGRKTEGDSFGELVSGTLGDIGRGVSQVPAIGLNIKKIEATGANKRMTTKPVLDRTTGEQRFATNKEIIQSQGLLVPIDKKQDFEYFLQTLEAKEQAKEKADIRKAKAKKLSTVTDSLGNATDMVKQGAQIFANIDKGAFTGSFADAATGISGLLGGTKVLYDRVLKQGQDRDPNFNYSKSQIDLAIEKKFGKGFGALEQQNKSNLTGLVYTILQIQEPGGRYSDQDARRVLEQLGDSSNPELFKVGLNTTLGNVAEKALSNWERATGKNRKELKDGPYDSLLKFAESSYESNQKSTEGDKKGKGAEIPESSIDFIKKRTKLNEPKLPSLKGQ